MTNSYQSKAFSVMTEQSTRAKYRLTWKKFIAFILRAYTLPDAIKRK